MSPVNPLPLGTISRSAHVVPPFVETYTGATLVAPLGLTVNAEPTMWVGSAGSTARFGSASLLVSLLCGCGIMSITLIRSHQRHQGR